MLVIALEKRVAIDEYI